MGSVGARQAAVPLAFGPLDELRSFFQALAQRAFPAERPDAGTRAHAHAIVCDACQGHHPLVAQRGNRLREQVVEGGVVRHAKITQRVMVHRDAPAQPTIRIMGVAHALQLARTPDPVNGGIQPQRDQDLRVNRWPPCVPLARLDRGEKRRDIQALDKAPHQSRGVARWQQRLKVGRGQFNLGAIRRLVARRRIHLTGFARRHGWHVRQHREFGIAHARQGMLILIRRN